ncbi:MAG TPA: NUDIX hydrolase [Thermoanaerobaculia bacterium]|nr:NUDIX hydrolase [Thermoanaerobaculia bacterium]
MIDKKSLLEELDRYVPGDEAEAASLAKIRDLLTRAPDPFTRRETEHITASAVVARPDASAFLLVHHKRLDRWLQPGGHVEPEDETALASALREAREETGVPSFETPLHDRILDLDVHPIPAFPDRPPHVHFDLRYLATTRLDPPPDPSDEVLAARWFSLADALAAGVDASLARALRKASAALGTER